MPDSPETPEINNKYGLICTNNDRKNLNIWFFIN